VSDAPAAAVPTGNLYDKYGSTNPLVRRMMSGFRAAVDELWERAAPESLLDVGCGEGVLTADWAQRLRSGRAVGIDLDDPALRAEWGKRARPNLEFVAGDAGALPFDADAFDMATGIEVLEHVRDPDAVLAEMARVARRRLLVSVPREPIWRVLNVARGAYLTNLGNTPGHVNHWTKVGFHSLLTRHGRVLEVRTPLPWTVALVGLD
jgi:ubiquinone/menaquinone biosynthesis C-methylase UbiE